MSQAGILNIPNNPAIPTQFTEDIGTAIPVGNNLNIRGGAGITTSGLGSTVTITAIAGAGQTITGNSGGPISPTLGNWNTLGSGSITISGAGSTLTTQLTGLTNHAVLVGAGTSTITKVGPGLTNTVLLGVTGLDPIFGVVPNGALANSSITLANGNNITVTGSPVPLGGTATIAVSGTTNHAVQIGNLSGSLTSLGVGATNTVLLGNTGADPSFGQVPNAALVNSSITVSAGIGLTGGGTVSLGGSTTLTVSPSLQITSGFATFGGAGNYFDDTTLGSFTILRPGTGYINTVPISWTAPQTVSGLTAGNCYLIYIDNTGTIQKSVEPSTVIDNGTGIGLFNCLRDSTSPTNRQITVRENHPFNMATATYNYLDSVIGTVIENDQNGANIAINGTQKVQINGADVLSDNGLTTTIADSGGVGVTWNQMFTNAGGKWATSTISDTFTGQYNNAGTVTALGASKFAVYTLYVSKDNLTSSTPTYYAVLDTQQYNNATAANTAITNGTTAKATNELAALEFAQLGFIVYSQSANAITSTVVAKSTLRGSIASGSALVTVQFDVLVGGAGNTITSIGPGSAGQILQSGGAAANPAYSTATYPSIATGTGKILIADGTNWVASTPTYPNASATAGKILISDGTNFIASTPTYPNTSGTAGKVLISDGTNNVYSTPTFPNASATLNKVIKSDGTNWVASTETYAAPGTSGNVMTSDGTNWTSAAASGGGTTTTVTTFNASGTWTKAAGSTQMAIFCYNGGAGGGSGRRGATTAAGGGGGGAPTQGFVYVGPSSFFNSTETVTIGNGGTGGLAVTLDNTNGNPGGDSNVSSFGNLLATPTAGSGGKGGTTTISGLPTATTGVTVNAFTPTSTALTAPIVNTNGINTAAANIGNNTFAGSQMPSTAGSGGGADSGTARSGGNAGGILGINGSVIVTGGSGGIETGTVNGGIGTDATVNTKGLILGATGGGGGGGMKSIGPGTGGQGGLGGGPGGGGGGSINLTNSGAGGNGGGGLIVVIEWTNFGGLI